MESSFSSESQTVASRHSLLPRKNGPLLKKLPPHTSAEGWVYLLEIRATGR